MTSAAAESTTQTPDGVAVQHGVAAPSVGRIVHVKDDRSGECRAAIVSGVSGTMLDLTVFHPGVLPEVWSVRLSEDGWHWPERNAG